MKTRCESITMLL